MNDEDISDDLNIPGMNLDTKYSKVPLMNSNSGEVQRGLDKTKKDLDKLKGFILKKFPFTQALSILPAQAVPGFVKEKEIPVEAEKLLQLYMVVPEKNFKEIPKIKKEVIDEIEKSKQKIWLQVKTPVDIFGNCLDSRFELTDAIGLSYPIYDDGFLGALRVAGIHKSLVLQRFEKYVVSYVIAGSLVRGEAKETSDVDVFIVINDTDVKRMPRLELKERLRGQIYQMVAEATSLAGVKNKLEPQIYLLTDFWESVKDAHPVIFTFIRDGIPLYDRGTFMPWKALLQMGKLKPSPEAIDVFMKTADKTNKMVERRLLDAMIDVYYGVLTPSQALIMLNGSPAPTHKETPRIMEEIFVKKEKMLKKSDLGVLTKAVKCFKTYEHDLKYTISGKEVDQLVKDAEVYVKRLKDLRKQIEKKAQERTIEQVYKEIFEILEAIFKKKSVLALIKEFEDKLVKKGKFTSKHLQILKEIVNAKKEFQKGKLDSHKVDNSRKNATILINDLLDYTQRCELVNIEKERVRIKYKDKDKDKYAELLNTGEESFLFLGNQIMKVTDKIYNSNMKEVSSKLEKVKPKKELKINSRVFEILKNQLGEFEILI